MKTTHQASGKPSLESDGAVTYMGIKLGKGYRLKNGKAERVTFSKSVSETIRQRKSKKQRVVSPSQSTMHMPAGKLKR